MKFFIPAAATEDQAEQVLRATREFAEREDTMGANLDGRRIYRLAGVHNGKPFEAKVGETFEALSEAVVAIIHDVRRDLYLVCTLNRGVARGTPYLVGANELRDSEDFEPEASATA